jgi:hypothetical protein
MGSIFWDSKGALLVEFLDRCDTINSEPHMQTLKKLKECSAGFGKTTANLSAHKGGACYIGLDCSLSSFLWSQFSTLRPLPSWHSKETVLQMILSLNTVCIKRSDASAKGFMQPAHSVSHTGGRSLFIMKQSLWKNNLNFAEDVHTIRTFHYNCDYSLRKNRKHYFCNALHTLFNVWKET